MSLHLANLSPRVRKDDLERVFRRFGRCTVQLKEGYGFAVYDFRGDADKALRTLKGRKICGEPVYLSWSNKQPKPLQRFGRAARSHDMRYGRNSDRADNFVARKLSRSRRDYSMNDKLLDEGRERHKSAEICDDRGNFDLEDVGLVHYDQRELVLEEGGGVEAKPNQLDKERWDEQADNLRNDNDFDGLMEFDRYEPDCGDERGEEYENRGLEHFAGLHYVVTSPNKNRRTHVDNNRGHQGCFKCGAVGHKMHDCPLEEGFLEKSTYHPDDRHDAKAKSEVERAVSRSGWRLHPSSRNWRSTNQEDIDRKLSLLGKDEVNSQSSPGKNDSRRGRRNNYHKIRRRDRNYDRKQGRGRDDQIVETHDDKKSKVLALSHLHSDCTSPEFGSRSVKPLVGSSSRCRSRSPILHSLSTSSRSYSRSRRSRSRSCKTKSRSKSRSPSSSLSISLSRSLPSSPNMAEVKLNSSSEGAPSLQSKEALTEVRQDFEPEIREDNLSIANRGLSKYTDNALSNQLMEVPLEKKQLEHDSKEETPTSPNHTEVRLNGLVEDGRFYQPQEAVPEEKQLLELESMQNFNPQPIHVPLQSEDVSSSGKMLGDMKLDQLHNDRGSPSNIHVSCDVELPYSSLLEKVDKESAAVNMAAEKRRETKEPENAKALEIEEPLVTAVNSDLKAPSKLHSGCDLSISAEEMCRVLKHYGLEHPEENEQNLDIGDYFGSSRLWPWEMVYYRRLRKGPISIENYARRVAQNKAFNITDKYIRSSSGWGEMIEEHR